MNIAVVDDEKVILEQISGLVRKQIPDCCRDIYAIGGEGIWSGSRGSGKNFRTRYREKSSILAYS